MYMMCTSTNLQHFPFFLADSTVKTQACDSRRERPRSLILPSAVLRWLSMLPSALQNTARDCK